jgi:hypothetical protein
VQVQLPTEGVFLAYDLMHAETLKEEDTVAHVALSHDADAGPLLAVLGSSGVLDFYSVHLASGTVTKRARMWDGVEAIETIALQNAALTGAALSLLQLSSATWTT